MKARHTPKPRAQARLGSVAERYAGACRNRVNGICWSYASSRARHPSPQGGGAESPSLTRPARFGGSGTTSEPIAPLTRTLGEIEVNGCAMFACGVESATSIHLLRKW